jgi:nucleoside-diphosphate kinase
MLFTPHGIRGHRPAPGRDVGQAERDSKARGRAIVLEGPPGRRYKRATSPRHDDFPRRTPMATERTFSIIKPDATERNLTGAINALIESAGLRIVAQKRVRMSRREAETFYAVHKERPFFGELVDFMISGPVVVQVLEGENAVMKYREIMGATNPENAAEGTIRKKFARSLGENSVHGSDSPENARIEIAQFFSGNEIVG